MEQGQGGFMYVCIYVFTWIQHKLSVKQPPGVLQFKCDVGWRRELYLDESMCIYVCV